MDSLVEEFDRWSHVVENQQYSLSLGGYRRASERLQGSQ